MRRYYEGQYAGIFNLNSLPRSIILELGSCKARLIESVDRFFGTHDYCNAVDRAVTLRCISTGAKLSLYSPRMKAATLNKFSDAALPASKRLVTVDVDVGDSHVRRKYFLTQEMGHAQVRYCNRLHAGVLKYSEFSSACYRDPVLPSFSPSPDCMQRNYLLAHEAAMDSFNDAMHRAWRSMCSPDTSSVPPMLCVLMAKEFTEWGSLLSSIAEASHLQGWSLPAITGRRLMLQR